MYIHTCTKHSLLWVLKHQDIVAECTHFYCLCLALTRTHIAISARICLHLIIYHQKIQPNLAYYIGPYKNEETAHIFCKCQRLMADRRMLTYLKWWIDTFSRLIRTAAFFFLCFSDALLNGSYRRERYIPIYTYTISNRAMWSIPR